MDFANSQPVESRQHVYQVSELNQNIKKLLEDKYPFLWISGEISNFRIPSSGHCYFTLKDRQSQIGAVMFRSQAGSLKFRLEDGMSIVGLGRISVYEPRGTYQVIFEYIEPKGIGALLIAFEKLKRKLSDEGLFDADRKASLPMLPGKISVISSPTGAAVRDFIHVAQRRFPNLPLEVVPVSVQGDRAPAEIIRAIRLLNEMASTDLIVLARGGGSIEDLSVFNDEQLVRTICDSQIPIVSAVGHETDFTLADFAADLRAPTPSAAAELCVPSKETLHNQLSQLNQKLHTLTNFLLKTLKNRLASVEDRIVHPRRRIQDWHIRLDDYSQRLIRVAGDSLDRRRQSVAFYHSMLMQVSPARRLPAWRSAVDAWQRGLFGCARQTLIDRRNAVARHLAMLDALNPMAILQRGYSITRALPNRTIVHSARQVDIDQRLEVLLRQGRLTVTVNARDVESD